jgi:GNAT superfamily N-acetyltransferase
LARFAVTAAPVDEIAFRALDGRGDCELLLRFHREILAAAFSADELDDVEIMAHGLRGERAAQTLASVALGGDDDTLLGGVVGELYRRERVLLLAYLAVRPTLRGRGIGTALLKYAAAHWYASPDVGLAVGEVHDPRRWPTVAGEDAARRLRFYERFGARVLDVPFVQPGLANGRPRIPGFLLIALYVDPATVVVQGDGESLRADLLGRFVRRYYETAEGAHEPWDAELARLLAVIDRAPTIALMPLAEYERVPLLRSASGR